MKRKRDRSKETTCFCDAVKFPHRALTVWDCQWRPAIDPDPYSPADPPMIERGGHYFIQSDGTIGHD